MSIFTYVNKYDNADNGGNILSLKVFWKLCLSFDGEISQNLTPSLHSNNSS